MLGDHVYDFIMIPVSGSGDGQFILLGMIDKMHLLYFVNHTKLGLYSIHKVGLVPSYLDIALIKWPLNNPKISIRRQTFIDRCVFMRMYIFVYIPRKFLCSRS